MSFEDGFQTPRGAARNFRHLVLRGRRQRMKHQRAVCLSHVDAVQREHVQMHIQAQGGISALKRRHSSRVRFSYASQVEELLGSALQRPSIEISYNPEIGVLILPVGEFRADSEGSQRFPAFGRLAAMLQRLKDQHGVEARLALEQGLAIMKQVFEGFESGAKLQLRDSTGRVEHEWETLQMFFHYIDRMSELDPE